MQFNLGQVEELSTKNESLRWEGWTLIHSKLSKIGWARTDGEWSRKDHTWAIAKRYDPQPDGLYHIPKSVYDGLQH